MAPILPFRNRLAYPGGLAGFDPAHPVARGVIGAHGLSVVANANGSSGGGVYRDLVRGKSLAVVSTAQNVLTLDPIIGPAIAVTGNNGVNVSTGAAAQADPEVTIAATIVYKSAGANQPIISPGGATSTNAEFYINATGGVPAVFGSGNVNSALALTANRPYFLVASASNAASIVNFVVLDLLTGSVRSQVVAGAVGSGSSGDWWIGADGFGSLTAFPIATVMYAPVFASMPQLLQWAQDLWPFWYPQYLDLVDMLPTPIQVSVGLVPGAVPPWSLPGLGPASRRVSLLNAALPTQVVAVPPSGGTLPFMGVG